MPDLGPGMHAAAEVPGNGYLLPGIEQGARQIE